MNYKEKESDDDLSGFDKMAFLYENGTMIPSLAFGFAGTKAGKMAAIGGNYVYKSSTYAAQRALARELAIGSKFVKGAGKALGWGGVILTAGDMYYKGINTSNSLDMTMGIVSMKIPGGGWIVGGIYFIGNAALEAGTGKDFGQWIDVGVNKLNE